MPEINKLLTHPRNFPLYYEQLPRQGVWACAGQVTCSVLSAFCFATKVGLTSSQQQDAYVVMTGDASSFSLLAEDNRRTLHYQFQGASGFKFRMKIILINVQKP